MVNNMGFECVVRALASGYMVRRPSWDPNEHLEISYDEKTNTRVVMRGTIEGRFSEYAASSDDILAKDWEKYGNKRKSF